PAPVGAATRAAGLRRLAPALPATIALVLLFIAPMAFMLVFSFWRTNTNFDLVPDWNVDNYTRFFTVPTYIRTFLKTMAMAAAVTVAGLATALPFTYFLVRYVSRRWQRLILLAVIVPFWTSYLLRVYAWQAILGEKGVLNQVLMGLGILDEPSRLFVYNDVAVFIVLLYVYFPFAALALYASLEKFDFGQLHAAQDLGARPDQAFRHILLPQIRSGIITACIFVFIPILGEFLTPTLVGGVQGSLIANLVVNFFRGAQIAQGAAFAIVIALFVTALLIVFRKYLKLEDVVARG
ncbi:MAG: ABC transporter permease, partial [Chloroflexi bacterium]|nr:ABC transporter permease [Chloroflexota bacterium]